MEQTPTESVVVETIVASASANDAGGVMADVASSPQSSSFFEKLAFWIVCAVTVLVPFVVLPVAGLPLDGGKKFFVTLGILLSLALWFGSRVKSGSIVLPRGLMMWSGILALGAMLLSALNSANPLASLWGTVIETQTFSSLLVLFGAAYLVSIFFQSHTRLHSFFRGAWYVSLAVFVVQFVRLAIPKIFVFAALQEPSLTLLGKWYDFGIFSGLMLILSTIALESGYRGVRRGVLWAVFALSFVSTILADFFTVWAIVLLVGLGALAYRLLIGKRTGSSRVSWIGVALVVMSLVFVFAGAPDQFAGKIVAKLGVPTVLEVRPSWGVTFDVAKSTLAQHWFLGNGLNRFVNAWYLYRPDSVNQTLFWSTDFNSGVGLVPTLLVTAGLFGFLSWILFILLFVWIGFWTIARNTDHPLCATLVFSYLGALYLWIFSIVYIPDTTILYMTAVFTALFIAARASLESKGNHVWSFSRNRRTGFVLLLFVLLLALLSVVGIYMSATKLYAIRTFQKGVQAATMMGDVDGAEKLLVRATELDRQDLYFRTLAELDVVKLNRLLNSGEKDENVLREQFKAFSGAAITHATEAAKIDPTRHANWISLGAVYAALTSAKVQGAYEMAMGAYKRALEVYPQSPSVQLQFARLEVAKGDTKKAREYLAEALKRKSNFTEAIFFLSQLEAQEGNISSAIKASEQALLLSPNDVGVAFQLGLLNYTKRDYAAAAVALERAVAIVPSYSNARYFLGLSYSHLGKKAEAIAQFTEIQKYNPDNAEVKQILANLDRGKDPLDTSSISPEKRGSLPLPEEQ